MAVPLEIDNCKVSGRFLIGQRDGSDADRDVDGNPVSGLRVTIKPSISIIRNMNTSPPSFVALDDIVVYTGSDGRMIGFSDDDDGIMVIANDAEGISPSGTWYYTATVEGDNWPTQRINFFARANGSFDLVRDMELPIDISAAVTELTKLRDEFEARIAMFQNSAKATLG